MKHLTLLLLLILPFTLSAETVTDTITNWQVYKDGQLLLKSHEGNPQVVTITIDKNDNFKELKISINQDMPWEMRWRKLMFKINGKTRLTEVRQLQSSKDPIVFTKDELLKLTRSFVNKTFTVEFTDGAGDKGKILFKLVVKE